MSAGLHSESLADATAQAAALCNVLQGVDMPVRAGLLEVRSLPSAFCLLQPPRRPSAEFGSAFLVHNDKQQRQYLVVTQQAAASKQRDLPQGRLEEWLLSSAGVQAAGLLPSVRCGLEAALLSALAAGVGGTSLAALLSPPAGMCLPTPAAAAHPAGFGAGVQQPEPVSSNSSLSAAAAGVAAELTDSVEAAGAAGSIAVCGLVDSCESAEATAAAAAQLVLQGYTTLKLKVRFPATSANAVFAR